jgi:hypothetical protein
MDFGDYEIAFDKFISIVQWPVKTNVSHDIQ